VANPGDKVEASTAAAIEPEADRTTGHKMPNLSWYPSVLIYGVPGAGKSTFTEQEVAKRLKEGHRVIVLDPHAACGQWQGCEVVGAGMDYEAIDAKLVWFQKQVKDRYKVISSQSNPKFQPLTIVGEEFTNWSKRCDNSGEHFQTVNSDIRKAECYSIIVSHTRNLAGLGDAKGMGALRDESMLEVEILGEYNAETERATPRFEAMVKLPGQSLSDRTLVKLAKYPTATAPESTAKPTTTESASDYLDRVYKLEFDLSKPEPSEPDAEPLNRPQDEDNSDSEPKFTSLDLSRKQAIELIQRLRTELNQTQVIERLWDCKKGGSEAWKKAYAQFKELMGGE
jgi:peptidoglycan hydrolase-like protein with peptidoglycan-binding domain